MKKFRYLALALSLVLLLQCFTGLAVAAEPAPAGDSTDSQSPVTAPTSSSAPLAVGENSVLNGCRSIEGMVPLSGNERRLDTAQSVFVFDTKTNTVVYSFNPDMKMSPGTLTKLVTALVVVENCDLNEMVVCHSRNISRLPAQTQNVDLKDSEELSVEELLYCLILYGANDAAVALSEHVAGNMQSFVSLMNNRVRQIGCTSTEFANVHGLDTGNSLSTARDIAKIYMECWNVPIIRTILSNTRHTVPKTNRSEERSLIGLNHLMDEITVAKYYDLRVTGGMPSYTNNSGAHLVCSASDKKSSLDLVLVILGAERVFAENGWLVTHYGNFDEMIELLEFAFNGFKSCRIMYEGQSLYQLPVNGGECDVVVQPVINYDSVLPADCRLDNLIKDVNYEQINAPIKKGDLIGTISLSYRSSVVAEAELYAMNDVARAAGSSNQGAIEEQGNSKFTDILVTICLVILVPAVLYLVINALRRAYGKARRRRRRAARRRRW